jgi:DNA-3-methyladenine glycosylase
VSAKRSRTDDAPLGRLRSLRPLTRDFYRRSPRLVARDLLGRLLVRDAPEGRVAGRIVEVEAYDGANDAASHAYRGETARNRVMFGPPGYAYVYFTYGMHHCMNVVTGPAGRASAVLVRALEPVAGLDLMRSRRGLAATGEPADARLARGPGCVAQALGLTRADDGLDLTQGPLWIADADPDRCGRRVVATPRIGIRHAADLPWRYALAGHPCVSGPRRSGLGPVGHRSARRR